MMLSASASNRPATMSSASHDIVTWHPLPDRVTSHVTVCGACWAKTGANTNLVRSTSRLGALTSTTSDSSAGVPVVSTHRTLLPSANSPSGARR